MPPPLSLVPISTRPISDIFALGVEEDSAPPLLLFADSTSASPPFIAQAEELAPSPAVDDSTIVPIVSTELVAAQWLISVESFAGSLPADDSTIPPVFADPDPRNWFVAEESFAGSLVADESTITLNFAGPDLLQTDQVDEPFAGSLPIDESAITLTFVNPDLPLTSQFDEPFTGSLVADEPITVPVFDGPAAWVPAVVGDESLGQQMVTDEWALSLFPAQPDWLTVEVDHESVPRFVPPPVPPAPPPPTARVGARLQRPGGLGGYDLVLPLPKRRHVVSGGGAATSVTKEPPSVRAWSTEKIPTAGPPSVEPSSSTPTDPSSVAPTESVSDFSFTKPQPIPPAVVRVVLRQPPVSAMPLGARPKPPVAPTVTKEKPASSSSWIGVALLGGVGAAAVAIWHALREPEPTDDPIEVPAPPRRRPRRAPPPPRYYYVYEPLPPPRRRRKRKPPPRRKSTVRVPAWATIREEFIRCGNPACRPCRMAPSHGPYLKAYWRDGNTGRLRSKYLGKPR